jgi:hypothetical protein
MNPESPLKYFPGKIYLKKYNTYNLYKIKKIINIKMNGLICKSCNQKNKIK